MQSRAEVTTRYAQAYVKAKRKDPGRIMDDVMSVTGWSRDNARRRLTAAAKRPPGAGRQVATTPRRPRSLKFSHDALKVLQRVWAASGGLCGKCLAASMSTQLDGLERHGELVLGVDRYSLTVRSELPSMSAASMDRYLKPRPELTPLTADTGTVTTSSAVARVIVAVARRPRTTRCRPVGSRSRSRRLRTAAVAALWLPHPGPWRAGRSRMPRAAPR